METRATIRRFLPWIGLALLAALPYVISLGHPLLHDDRVLVYGNDWMRKEAGPLTVFRHDYWHGSRHAGSDLYRPVTILTLVWNSRHLPEDIGFRSVNLLLHGVATLVVAWTLSRLFSRAPSRDFRSSGLSPGAWIGAAIFAVHPLASEAVLWVVGRAEILAAISGLLAFRLFVGLGDRDGAGGWRLAASLAAFFLALCSKESAAAWLLIGLVWWLLGHREDRRTGRTALVQGAAHVSVFVVFLVLRGLAVGWGTRPPFFVDNPLVRVDALTRVANATLLQGLYFSKMLWPRTLSVDYGYDQIPVARLVPWGAIGALAIVSAWAGIAFLLWRRSRVAAFLWAFIPAAFAVTGNFALPIGTNFAERLSYLPLVGACGLAGYGLSRLPGPAWPRITATVLILIAAAGRTVVRGQDYRDVATLHEATVRATPRAVKSLTSLGLYRLQSQESPRLAIPVLERAVEIWPDYPRALELLSKAYGQTHQRARELEYTIRTREAAKKLEKELSGSNPPAD